METANAEGAGALAGRKFLLPAVTLGTETPCDSRYVSDSICPAWPRLLCGERVYGSGETKQY